MENKLTRGYAQSYPVSSMDEQVDAKAPGQPVPSENSKNIAEQRKKDDEEAKKRNISVEQVRNERIVRQAWEKIKQNRINSGKKFTAAEEEDIKNKIAKGEMPQIGGGSIDMAFEGFDAEKYKNNKALYQLARELKDIDRNSPNLQAEIDRITRETHSLIGALGVTDQEGTSFLRDISAELQKLRGSGEKKKEEESSGDGNLENINDPRFQGTPLEPLANEIAAFGADPSKKLVLVNPQQKHDWENRARQSGADKDLIEVFINQLSGDINGHNGEVAMRMQEAQAAQQGQGNGEKGGQQGRRFDAAGNEILENTPRSIQEICKWIIKKEGDEWDVGGSSPLLDEKENFNQANFVKWVRERMMHFHNLDPNNPSINLLGSVGIETEFKTVGLISMINNKKQYFKDEHKKIEGTDKNVVYSDLVEDIVNEVYLFNTSRNHDASYRFAMWNDEELPKLLQQIHQKSDFTTGEQMKKIFALSENYHEKGYYEQHKDERPDTKVGDTVRTIYEAYYSIADYEDLKRVLGEDNPFFTRKGFEDAWRLTNGKDKDYIIPDNYKGLFNTLFDGKTPDAKPNVPQFLEFINLFNNAGKKQSDISLVREALRIAGAHAHGLDDGLNATGDKRKVARNNLEYAELWAYSMVRWTGAAAKNDTGAIGYDAFTKSQRFQQYRIRQSSDTRGAPIGNQYDLPVVKAWNLDLLNGIFVEQVVGEHKDINHTPMEVLRMLDGVDEKLKAAKKQYGEEKNIPTEILAQLHKEKDDALNRLQFKQYTQLDYANNHLGKSFQMFHSMLGATELNLDQIVTHDRWRGLVFDRPKFEETVKENFIKPIRYALSTYANIDYTKDIRVHVNALRPDEPPQYETKTMAEAMFGPVVLQEYYKKEKGPDGKQVIDKEKLFKERNILYKKVIRSLIASHLEGHRRNGSGYAFMNYSQITKFIEALESIKSVEIEDVGENTQLSEGKGFFSHEDIAWIRKYSGTENWKMIMGDVLLKEGGMGFMGGLFKGFKDVFDDIAKG